MQYSYIFHHIAYNQKMSREELEEITCPICLEIPTIPVRLVAFECACTVRYCMTCVRDALNLNGFQNGANHNYLKSCPTCRGECVLDPRIFYDDRQRLKKNIKWTDVYVVDEELMEKMDEVLDPASCPRNCGWTGLRMEARNHLQQCMNTFRFKCFGCHKMFTKDGLQEHVNSRSSYRKCKSQFRNQTCICSKVFVLEDEYKEHYANCVGNRSETTDLGDLQERMRNLEVQ